MTTRRAWSPEDEQQLRVLYANTPTAELAERFGRDLRSVYTKAKKMGLKKSAEYLAAPGAGRIRKGERRSPQTEFGNRPSWNKGVRYDPGGRSVETRFKPGNVPHTYRPIGSEQIRDGYLWRKVREDLVPVRLNWRQVHQLVWEEHNGPIPDGHVVIFANGDRRDIRLENLELISRADLGRRNSMHRLPPEVRQVIRTKASLSRQINKMTRGDRA